MHNDRILHYLSLLKAPLAKFNPEDSLLMGKIPSLLLLQSTSQIEAFAHKVLQLFETYTPYEVITRCCLAKRVGAANMLYVLSSHNLSNHTNRMNPGYFCFVKPNSTLLNLKLSDMRSFKDAKEVAMTFTQLGDPPQRSIRLISEAGYKAGLCLPLFINRRARGYLFFNSSNEFLYELRPVDYAVFSFLEASACLLLSNQDLPSDQYDWLSDQAPQLYLADFMSPAILEQALAIHARLLGHHVHIKEVRLPSAPYLISHGNVANLICRFLQLVQVGSATIEVKESDSRLFFQVNFEKGEMPAQESFGLQTLARDCRALEVNLQIRSQSIELGILKDVGDPGRVYRYSI